MWSKIQVVYEIFFFFEVLRQWRNKCYIDINYIQRISVVKGVNVYLWENIKEVSNFSWV